MGEKYEYSRKLLERSKIPADQRRLALELYNLGEQDYALDFLIKQMNQYKDPSIHDNVKRETCMATALTLGRLRDRRAIEPLFDGLGEICRFAAAYALAKINGPEVEDRLLKLSAQESKKGIHAVIALGFLKNKKVISRLLDIMEHIDEYKIKYENDCAMDLIDNVTLGVIGLYEDNDVTDTAFRKSLTRSRIFMLLSGFVHEELYPRSFIITHEIGWKIVRKYGWDKYIESPEKRNACEFTHSEKWAEDLRNEIADQILEGIDKSH